MVCVLTVLLAAWSPSVVSHQYYGQENGEARAAGHRQVYEHHRHLLLNLTVWRIQSISRWSNLRNASCKRYIMSSIIHEILFSTTQRLKPTVTHTCYCYV